MVLKFSSVHAFEINFPCTSSSPLPATRDSRKHNEAESNGCASIVGKQVASFTVASHQWTNAETFRDKEGMVIQVYLILDLRERV